MRAVVWVSSFKAQPSSKRCKMIASGKRNTLNGRSVFQEASFEGREVEVTSICQGGKLLEGSVIVGRRKEALGLGSLGRLPKI